MLTHTLDLLWTISTQGMTQIVKKIHVVTGWVNNTCIPHSTIMTQLFKNTHYPFSISNITVFFFIIQSMPTITAIYIHEYKKYCWILPFWDFKFPFQLLRYRFSKTLYLLSIKCYKSWTIFYCSWVASEKSHAIMFQQWNFVSP